MDGQAAKPGIGPAPLILALGVTLLHLALAGRYDLFRDELYFIVCGQHPAFGYVDQPPLVPLLAAGLHSLAGSVWLLRLPIALAAGALVWVTALLARELGGGRLAMALAAAAVALAPMLHGLGAVLNTTSFDPLAWTLIALLLTSALRRGEDRALWLAGLIAGIDLEIKYSLAMWAVGLAIGLLASPARAFFTRRAFWLGLGIAALIALPSALWQAAHGFPFLELAAAARGKNADTPLAGFLANQAFVMNPLLAPLWLAGLAAPFASRRLADMRFLPIAYAVLFVLTRIGHGKDYYLAACYPALFALGAVALAPHITTPARKAALALTGALATAAAAFALPIALPVLAPDALAAYMQRHGLAPQAQERNFHGTQLPQVFADQLGWHDFAAQVLVAWQQIPAEARSRTAIMADNYGEAAALDLYAAPHGLPPALSGHNQYHLWGLRGQHPADLVTFAASPAELAPFCARVTQLGETRSRWAMAYENGKAIVRCEGLKRPLATIWPRQKHFD